MVCPHCHVTIACRTDSCPLCHATFNASNTDINELKRLPRAYPPRGKGSFFESTLFDKVYLLLLLNVVLISLVSELIITGKLKVFWAIAGTGIYLYFLIRATITDTKYFSQKVVGQALLLTGLGFAFLGVVPNDRPLVIFEIYLPCVYMVSMVMLGIYIILNYKSPRLHLISLISVAFLGVLPICAIAIGKKVQAISQYNPVMAIITAVFGGVIIITTVAFSLPKIISELKRKFHF